MNILTQELLWGEGGGAQFDYRSRYTHYKHDIMQPFVDRSLAYAYVCYYVLVILI